MIDEIKEYTSDQTYKAFKEMKAQLLAEILKGLPKKKTESSKAWEYFGYSFSTHDDKLAFNSAIAQTTQYIEQLFNEKEKK